ncbi:MAG: GPR endopeptidase [Clostridia bacterium]|nr:GPR endopeptidase [Clostridia bacterium]
MLSFRTDLADERTILLKEEIHKQDIDGITTSTKQYSNNVNVCTVNVINEIGSKKIDKKIGIYKTINIENIDIISNDELEEITEVFVQELSPIINNFQSLLIVGLGNEDTTADSIGPKVIKNLEITRHIMKYHPELLPSNSKEISAIFPGVLGTTGIETQEILKGIVNYTKPEALVVIDALASNNISRLLKTIQICNTGIVPGAGVGNKRDEISFETLGIPVIAIGVPTVVSAATIVADTLDILTQQFEEFSFIKNSSHSDKQKLIEVVLEPAHFNLAVMPKEIDTLVDNMKEIISSGINALNRN